MPVAYCYQSGEIDFAPSRKELPEGTIAFLVTRGSLENLKKRVSVKARHAYDGETLLVPGVPEAENGGAALSALHAWASCAFPKGAAL